MRNQFKWTKILLGLALVGLLTLSFNLGNSGVLAAQAQPLLASPDMPLSPFPTLIRTVTARPPTSSPTATLVSGVLTCDTTAPGVTCTDYGTYLDYNINISVSGLPIGATASDTFIGTYQRTTNGGEMGMTSSFIHCETSGYVSNTVSSAVHIQPFDAPGIWYPWFTNDTGGTRVCVKNNAVNDWRYIAGSGGWPNWLSVKGDVNWSITGYSIVGHIYLYSNQNFMTVTPTSTPSRTPTATVTRTPTVTPTSVAECYGSTCDGYFPPSKRCDVDAQSYLARNLYNNEGAKIGEVHYRYSDACFAQWAQIESITNDSFYAEDSIRWGDIDYTSGMWPISGQIFNSNGSLYTHMYGVDGPVLPLALVCGSASVSTPVSYPPLTPPINLNSPYGLNNCIAR